MILLQGNLGVYKDYRMQSEEQLKVLSAGSFYGEMSLFLNQDQAHTLVALSQAMVLLIDRKRVGEFFSAQPDMAFNMIEEICRRLREADSTLEKYRRSEQSHTASKKSKLFPEGHGSYMLPMKNDNSDYLYLEKRTCPLCGHSFDSLSYIVSRLRLDRTDPDLRTRYKDFEPLYYEIVTCPNCFFSAAFDTFATVSKRQADPVNQLLGPYRLEMYIRTGMERDTFTVFAGYYLAIMCAPVCFDDYQLVTGNLWMKLSRLYQDVGDNRMYAYASAKSLEEYRYAYENLNVSEKASQQLCYLMADLYFRAGDVDTARNFFFLAKTNKQGSAVLARQADIRLEEIRELKQAGK
jgi:uncharacterized protein (DUF2225 family)